MPASTVQPLPETSVIGDAPSYALAGYRVHVSGSAEDFAVKASRIGRAKMSETAVIVADILRATTTLSAVGAAGVKGIYVDIKPTDGSYPFTPPSNQLGPWLGGGEENGKAIAGGSLANSPTEVRANSYHGYWLKFVSTNGARAIVAAERSGAKAIYLACLPNIHETVRAALDNGARRIFLSCGGFYGGPAIEDAICAGRAIAELMHTGVIDSDSLDDEARMALSIANEYADQLKLVRMLERAQVGRLLFGIGRGADVEAVVTGAGIDPAVWTAMARTVLQYTRVAGIGVFIPSLREVRPDAR